MDAPPPDPYQALGVGRHAETAAIRSAYRKLVMKCHPDKVPGKTDQFTAVQQAYELLNDDEKRRQYDESIKLAALRAEKRAGFREPDFATGSGPGPVFEIHRERRGDKVYTETVPTGAYRDAPREAPRRRHSSDDEDIKDYFSYAANKQPSSSKRYEDSYFDEQPRRASGRVYDDRPRRSKDFDAEYEKDRRYRAREAEKAQYRKNRAEKDRLRDLEKRRDSQRKFKGRSYSSDDYDSDSDRKAPRSPRLYTAEPRTKYEDTRHRSDRDDTPRRSKRGYDSHSDEFDKELKAKDYIRQSRTTARPPGFEQFHPNVDTRPPPAAPAAPPNDVRRSSGRRSSTKEPSPIRLSGKGRRPTEIVEPRHPPPPQVRPAMPATSSDPRGLKHMTGSKRSTQKSATLDTVPETRQYSTLQRSDTMPSRPPRGDSVPISRSKFKEHDSGYSSPGTTPEMKSTKYAFVESPDSESDEETVVVDHKGGMRREAISRSSFEKERTRHSKSDRPPLSSSHKHSSSISTPRSAAPPLRSGSSYAFTNESLPVRPPPLSRAETARPSQPPPAPLSRSESSRLNVPPPPPPMSRADTGRPPPPPPLSRADTARGPPPLSKESSSRSQSKLYGEIDGEEGPRGQKASYRIVHQSQKPSQEDIRYSDYPSGGSRRGSEDTIAYRDRDRPAKSHRGYSEKDRRREQRVH